MLTKRIIVLIAFYCISLLNSRAEEFEIKLVGEGLKTTSALEVRLNINPKNSYILSEEIKLSNENNLLFKFADVNQQTIRIFFLQALNDTELIIKGNLDHGNVVEQSPPRIETVNYISDFSKDISASIKSEFSMTHEDETLPYAGISRAEILGPQERIYSSEMFIAIANIETYGFTCDRTLRNVRINGQKAKFLNSSIISANLELAPEQSMKELDIVLEIDLDRQVIRKKVGTIKFLESL